MFNKFYLNYFFIIIKVKYLNKIKSKTNIIMLVFLKIFLSNFLLINYNTIFLYQILILN
jgi:hypothetical protein